jgi:hypothetical protein
MPSGNLLDWTSSSHNILLFSIINYPEDWGRNFPPNGGNNLTDTAVSEPRRPQWQYTSHWYNTTDIMRSFIEEFALSESQGPWWILYLKPPYLKLFISPQSFIVLLSTDSLTAHVCTVSQAVWFCKPFALNTLNTVLFSRHSRHIFGPSASSSFNKLISTNWLC